MFGLGTLQFAGIGLLALLLSSGAAYVWGYQRGNHYAVLEMQAASAKAIAKAAEDARALGIAEGTITFTAGQRFAEAQTRIVTRTITQIREVPVYVSQKADVACVINSGFVLLHDAAARGDDSAAAVSESGPSVLDSASAVRLSDVEEVVTVNYGKYHQVANELIALQGWVRDQAALRK